MNILTVENLSQNYGGLRILQDLSFSVESGKKVALIGPNGAGKTTLLNVLSGLIPHTAGRITFESNDVTNASPNKRVVLGLGRSFQITSLFTNLSLLDNLLLAVQGTKRVRFQIFSLVHNNDYLYAEAKKLLEPIDLWVRKDDPVSSLSHGEQRQIELILALSLIHI